MSRHSHHGMIGLVCLLFATACAVSQSTPVLAGEKTYTIQSGGLERSFLVHAPPSYDGKTALPLLVSLHGGWGTGEGQAKISGFSTLADREDFIAAYPDGVSRSWNAGDQCCDPARKRGVDDVGFVRDMIAKIKSDYRINPAKVYGTGFSNGGMLIHHIACVAPDLFTAVAVNAGALMNSACAPRRGLPFLIIQGKEDPRMPWNGGNFQETYRLPVVDLVKKIASRNQCSGSESEVSYERGPATCRTVKGCGKNEVTYCGVEGVGHQWIGGQTVLPKLLGQNTAKFNSSLAMWTFFERH